MLSKHISLSPGTLHYCKNPTLSAITGRIPGMGMCTFIYIQVLGPSTSCSADPSFEYSCMARRELEPSPTDKKSHGSVFFCCKQTELCQVDYSLHF